MTTHKPAHTLLILDAISLDHWKRLGDRSVSILTAIIPLATSPLLQPPATNTWQLNWSVTASSSCAPQALKPDGWWQWIGAKTACSPALLGDKYTEKGYLKILRWVIMLAVISPCPSSQRPRACRTAWSLKPNCYSQVPKRRIFSIIFCKHTRGNDQVRKCGNFVNGIVDALCQRQVSAYTFTSSMHTPTRWNSLWHQFCQQNEPKAVLPWRARANLGKKVNSLQQ